MKIRTKTTLIFLTFSLIPLVFIGAFAYKTGQTAIMQSLGGSFQQIANQTIDKVDRSLYDVHRNVKTWAELDLMEEVITGDLDGRISSFLIRLSKEYGSFSSIHVLNTDGTIIASSRPDRIGSEFNQENLFMKVIRGEGAIQDIHEEDTEKGWGVTFAFPIRSKSEKEKVIGVLTGRWKADELAKMTQVVQGEKGSPRLLLIRGDGLVISAPEAEQEILFKRNLVEFKLQSAASAIRKGTGYLIENDEEGSASLIGYDYSKGYRDFQGLGWSVLVVRDLEAAFEPIQQMKWTILTVVLGVGVLVLTISVFVTRTLTNPILEISQIASRVAQGDFEGKAKPLSKDEIGSLTLTFNRMIEDLKKQRDQLVDKNYVDSIIGNMTNSLIVINTEGLIERVNKATLDLLGFTEKELIDQPVGLIFPDDLLTMVSALKGPVEKGFLNNIETAYLSTSGQSIPVFFSGSVMQNNQGKIEGIICVAQDITERKKSVERLNYLASHDALTNLPNRTLFYDRLGQAISRVAWRNRLVAVLFLDLDRFKVINDTLGHAVGDLLLQEVSKRLGLLLRSGDTVARIGGDEFVIILDDVAKAEDVAKICQKILDALSKPFLLKEHELFITVSVGISLFPNDGRDAETLLKNADTAMYKAKEQGRNNYQHFSSNMNVKALERLALETNLRHALERNEFLLHFQPFVSLATGEIVGMEALIRWRHPDLGMVSPAQFIPLAEETGLIVPISEWVLKTACRQNKKWQELGLRPIRMAVNLSARQFYEKDFRKGVVATLRETGLEPHYLELELTEGTIMKSTDVTVTALDEFHQLGIAISIDDFGTGYSSLNYLKRFPVNKLKIDQSFVRDVVKDPDDAAITNAIVVLGHTLQLKTIAEGVETQEQLDFLRSIGCDEVQGYLFSKPLPAEEATKILAEGKRL
ncbi:MAG: EAL domain-containing protein [Candidatus Manganitrophus sp.]|nr:MAG: EAL domain-containing protein [Candidatus Manganitrophus sp.]